MHVDVTKLDAAAVASYAQKAEHHGTVDFFLNIIPHTFFSAFVQGEILQVLLLACLCGVVLSHIGETARPLLELIDQFTNMLFGAIGKIMRLAPLGAFGAMSYTIGSYGLETLGNLLYLLLSVYATSVTFVLVGLGLVARFCGFSIWKYLKYTKEELFIVLGTSSSETVLPRIMDKLERAGCEKSVVGLVIPTGYSFNLDGTSIYLTMAALFVAQACDIPLTFEQKLGILLLLLLTSKGAAAVAGGGFITLAATFSSMDLLPLAGLTLLLGVDPFMSQCRAMTNVIGNGIATIAIAKWERALDMDALHRALEGDGSP
jgi:aerobic C4-dicarboxylate transport protein